MRFTATDKQSPAISMLGEQLPDAISAKTQLHALQIKKQNQQQAESDVQWGSFTTFPSNLLGTGSFGFVYSAVFNNKKIAVKVITKFHNELINNEKDMLERIQELRIPNMVGYISCNFVNLTNNQKNYQFAFEYMALGSLNNILKKTDKISWILRFRIMKEVALAVAALHANHLLHRDIKPDNILLDSDYHAKLTDVGYMSDERAVNNFGYKILGTLLWMPPEGLHGALSTRSGEVYTFALAVLWTLAEYQDEPFRSALTHRDLQEALAFSRPSISSECPPSIAGLIGRGWLHEPSRRGTMADIVKGLEAATQEVEDLLDRHKLK